VAILLMQLLSVVALCRPVVMAGLKKETKKLTKTLKSHRKRLESLLAAQGAVMAPMGNSVVPQLSPAELHAVLSEIAQLQTSLAAVRNQQRQMAMTTTCESGCSSDSDSDCEDVAPRKQRKQRATMQPVQQLQGLQQLQASSSQPFAQQTVAAAVAAGAAAGSLPSPTSSSMGTVCLQAPLIDQEQPDFCQQLPPPQQYTTTGRVLVCQGKACMRKGALQVLQAASHATAASPEVEVLPCKCLGKCKQGPAMRIRTEQQERSSLVTEIEPLEVPELLDQLLC
jgi:(2Fe-2S) ferredoxin